MTQASPDLAAKIGHARRLPDREPVHRFGPFGTVAETLAHVSQARAEHTWLTWLAENGEIRTYTYAEFFERVRRIAAAMTGPLGLKRGDRIATAMHNHDQTILINFAAWHAGISVAPLNMGEEDKRLAYVLEHSGARALFVLPEYAARMQPLASAAPRIGMLICTGCGSENGAGPGWQYLEDIPPDPTPKTYPVAPEDEALVVYTSGTTGVPKGVALSQYNLAADAFAIGNWFSLTPDSRMMCVLPVHHVNGLVVTHVTPFCAGASVVLNRKFSAHLFFQTIAKYKINIVSVVPTLLQFLLESVKEFDRRSVESLQCIICGAGPLTVELAARFEDRFKIPIIHGYGLSETTCYSCFVPKTDDTGDDEHRSWMRSHGFPSIGIPLEINEMAIHDENGREAAEGARGEIVIRGHNVMLGYHENQKANDGAFTHGWFRSGDEGFYKTCPEGRRYFFISGRFKELIIRGGVKISPLEVDEVLNGIEGVQAAMAVGFDNMTYGEEVGAYVVRKAGADLSAEKVLAECRARLPFWMSPKVVVFGETFPVTSTGKYQRNQLKPLFGEWREMQFRAAD